jgi:TolA-binding protein
MLNRSAKKKALNRFNDEGDKLKEVTEEMRESAVSLFELRQESSVEVIRECESYLSSLASAPKELDRSVSELKTEFQDFQKEIREVEAEAEGVDKVSGSTAGAGAAAGAGVAAMGPSAAMAFATTFGTASTGTAISSLSGAAATNAALAWIGGGAVSAGGGGMAMGSTILSLSGPVGWTIGGVALAGSALYAGSKNKRIAQKANQKAKEARKKRGKLETALEETRGLIDLTEKHASGVEEQLRHLRESTPNDYTEFSNAEKERLGALINNVQALSELLNRNVEVDSDE